MSCISNKLPADAGTAGQDHSGCREVCFLLAPASVSAPASCPPHLGGPGGPGFALLFPAVERGTQRWILLRQFQAVAPRSSCRAFPSSFLGTTSHWSSKCALRCHLSRKSSSESPSVCPRKPRARSPLGPWVQSSSFLKTGVDFISVCQGWSIS